MKNREIVKRVAENIVDSIYEHIDEVTQTDEQFIAVLSQIKKLLK